MEITIARAKSLFCPISIKIIRYICGGDGCYLDTSKDWKILDYLKYIDSNSVWALLAVCVYY